MLELLLGIVIIVSGGLIALAVGHNRHAAANVAGISIWIGSILAGIPVVRILSGAPVLHLSSDWSLPLGRFSIGLDPLSAFFMLPILILGPLSAMYGIAYMSSERHRIGAHWMFFNLLIASMMVLLIARDGLLFLLAWEMMAVGSFFLVVYDDRLAEVRDAGWTYLVASHLGTAPLLIFFSYLGSCSASLEFSAFTEFCSTLTSDSMIPGLLFFLALIGFGTKAGIIPLHVWLPEAHPAAPSHVSAMMSGVMIKTGIYGLLRAMTFLGSPTEMQGWTLVIIGLVSGIIGVVLALAQHDIKRLLAYHSVENIGIIFLGIGAGVLGIHWNMPALAILGLSGGLLHVLNHALFKGLLFLGAGAVAHETGIRNMEALGGVAKRMPWTGMMFLVGSAAISGLPPFNGFISEFLIYFGVLKGSLSGHSAALVLGMIVLGGLGLIGGLAAACFTKCYGLVFLGEPRSAQAAQAHEAALAMRLAMIGLALLCLILGLGASMALAIVELPARFLIADSVNCPPHLISDTQMILMRIAGFSTALIALSGLLWSLRRRLTRNAGETLAPTWDCGYAAPTPRMQYTTSSYAAPLTIMFHTILGTRRHGVPVSGDFPLDASLETHAQDFSRIWIFDVVFRTIDRMISPLRILQHGRIHIYVLYIAITLVGLLIWKVGLMR